MAPMEDAALIRPVRGGRVPSCDDGVVRGEECRSATMKSYVETITAMSLWSRTRVPSSDDGVVRGEKCRSATIESCAWTVMQCQHGVVWTREGGDINFQRKNGTDAEQCRGRGKRIFASREAART